MFNQPDFEFNENSKHSSYSSWRETQENFLPSELLVPGGFLFKHRLHLLLFVKVKRHETVQTPQPAVSRGRRNCSLFPPSPPSCLLPLLPLPAGPLGVKAELANPPQNYPSWSGEQGRCQKKSPTSTGGGAREGPVALHGAGLEPKGVKPPGTSKLSAWSNASEVNLRSDCNKCLH